MHYTLAAQPDSPGPDIAITVDIVRIGLLIELNYRITGDVAAVLLPKPVSDRPERGDRLWEHTCFEAFWRAQYAEDYYEVNVAPSREYAIYHFSAYRTGMCAVSPSQPGIFYLPPNDGSALSVVFAQPFDGASHLALSAVIEETGGTKSYWALRHPPGPPDFHHPDCFAIELAAPRSP